MAQHILSGTDVPMGTVKIKDDTGSIILISALEDYNIYVYQLANNVKTNKFTFKKVPVGSDKPIIVIDTETLGFIVDRTMTTKCSPGDLYIEVAIKIAASGDYVSSFMKSGIDGLILCTILQSANPNGMA